MTQFEDEGQRQADTVAILKTLLAHAHEKLSKCEAEVERLKGDADGRRRP